MLFKPSFTDLNTYVYTAHVLIPITLLLCCKFLKILDSAKISYDRNKRVYHENLLLSIFNPVGANNVSLIEVLETND